jgi:hypothetical protein
MRPGAKMGHLDLDPGHPSKGCGMYSGLRLL